MKKSLSLLALVCTLCLSFFACAFAGTYPVTVAVTTPTNGATVTSPVAVQASASSSKNITGWKIYVDGALVWKSGAGSSINTSVSMAAGTHNVTVTALASGNNSGSVTRSITVTQPTASSVAVGITPTSATLQTGGTQQFYATVTGTTNTGVTWSTTAGTISSSGFYTAPSTTGTAVVTATSVADTTKSASATVTITAPTTTSSGSVAISVSPTSATVGTSGTVQFTATVSGTTNMGATWSVNGTPGGGSTIGTISGSGLYTAPACISTSQVTVTATSAADSTQSASANVTLESSKLTGNYYVSNSGSDSNDGEACYPWATIQHAANTVGAGSTVHVLPGTYTENALALNNSGTSSGHIRFVSDQQWGAYIRTTSSYTVVQINGSYVDFMGFDVTGDSGTCLGIANWASNNQIIGNRVHNIVASGTVCGSNGGSGIVNASYTASNDNILGNYVYQIGSWPTEDQRVHCIYASNPGGGKIQNNLAFRCAGFAIHLWHAASNYIISSNTVFEGQYGGIYIGNGDSPGGTYASNITVTNNFASNNNTYGIVEYGNIGSGNCYENNMVYNNGTNLALVSTCQSGNILSDPGTKVFVNYTGDATGDYHLASGSAAIDAGTTLGAPIIDMSGGKRPINSKYDIGCYEYGAAPAAWPWM